MKYASFIKKCAPVCLVSQEKLNGRVKPSYLLVSEDNAIRSDILKAIAMTILCPSNGCGVCAVCSKIENDNSTAYRVLEGEKISSDNLREFLRATTMYALEGSISVFAIPSIEKLQPLMQNKLLKSLEEPPENTIFLLGTGREANVLSTIRSRCELLRLPPLTQAELQEALQNEYGDSTAVSLAAESCGGLLSRAEQIINDAQYPSTLEGLLDVLAGLKLSADVPLYQGKPCFTKGRLPVALDLLELIFHDILALSNGADDAVILVRESGTIRELLPDFTNAAATLVLSSLSEAREKLRFNCSEASVVDSLLLNMLEVKYKCRQL